MNIDTTKLVPEFESSYEEDGKLHVLASGETIYKKDGAYIIPRWNITVSPDTREIEEGDFFLSLDEGFEYPDYTPTEEQMTLFRRWAKQAA